MIGHITLIFLCRIHKPNLNIHKFLLHYISYKMTFHEILLSKHEIYFSFKELLRTLRWVSVKKVENQINLCRSFDNAFFLIISNKTRNSIKGFSDVADLMMVIVLKCLRENDYVDDFFNVTNQSPTNQTCHQLKMSPTV